MARFRQQVSRKHAGSTLTSVAVMMPLALLKGEVQATYRLTAQSLVGKTIV